MRSPIRWAQFLVLICTLMAFSPAFEAEWLGAWDDNANFVENPRWRGLGPEQLSWMWGSSWMGHYQPLSWMTFGLEWGLWGLDPRGYHVVNVLLHAGSSLVLLSLLGRLAPRAGLAGWIVGGLFFAVHPLRVESVAWITERRDVLSMLLALCALRVWLLWTDEGRRRWFALAVGLHLLSLLAKAHAVTLPVVLLILDLWPLRRPLPLLRVLLEKLPFFASSVLCSLAAVAAQAEAGALLDLAERDVQSRFATVIYGLSVYPGKLLLPFPLSPLYYHEDLLNYPIALSAAALAAVAVGAVVLWRRAPWFGVGWAIYALVLLPVSGLFQAGPQLVADRYTYFSCLPFAFLVAAGVGIAAERWRPSLLLAGAWVLLLGWGTWSYTRVWRDAVSLWTHAVAVDPTGVVAHTNLAAGLADAGRTREAVGAWRAALKLHPSDTYALRYATALYRDGQEAEALRVLEQIPADSAEAARVACLMGTVLVRAGELERGLAVLVPAVESGACPPAARAAMEAAQAAPPAEGGGGGVEVR